MPVRGGAISDLLMPGLRRMVERVTYEDWEKQLAYDERQEEARYIGLGQLKREAQAAYKQAQYAQLNNLPMAASLYQERADRINQQAQALSSPPLRVEAWRDPVTDRVIVATANPDGTVSRREVSTEKLDAYRAIGLQDSEIIKMLQLEMQPLRPGTANNDGPIRTPSIPSAGLEAYQRIAGLEPYRNVGVAIEPEVATKPADPHEPAIDLDGSAEVAVPKARGREIDL